MSNQNDYNTVVIRKNRPASARMSNSGMNNVRSHFAFVAPWKDVPFKICWDAGGSNAQSAVQRNTAKLDAETEELSRKAFGPALARGTSNADLLCLGSLLCLRYFQHCPPRNDSSKWLKTFAQLRRRDGICGLEEGYPPGAHREEDDAGTGRSGATTSYVPGVIIDLLFSLFPVSPTRLFVVSGRRLLILMHFTEAAGGSGTERYCNVPAINEKPQIIQEYESGKAIPNNQILAKLERVLGCKLRGNLKK
eukprot:1194708-Prorocentrum_minimum.AAC.7